MAGGADGSDSAPPAGGPPASASGSAADGHRRPYRQCGPQDGYSAPAVGTGYSIGDSDAYRRWETMPSKGWMEWIMLTSEGYSEEGIVVRQRKGSWMLIFVNTRSKI